MKKFFEIFHISYSSIRSNLKDITNYIYNTWKFTYISKYKDLPLNKINVILDITNYPNYKMVYEDK